jgi:hypothetical protein
MFAVELYANLWTPPAQGDLQVPTAWNARIYPACCGTVRVPGLDGGPLLLASLEIIGLEGLGTNQA